MKIYISGKITGDSHYKAKFQAKERELAEQGHTVISPAHQPEGLTSLDYMRICFAMMDAADAVLFLPDYVESRGAMLERAWCQYVGKLCIYDPTHLEAAP